MKTVILFVVNGYSKSSAQQFNKQPFRLVCDGDVTRIEVEVGDALGRPAWTPFAERKLCDEVSTEVLVRLARNKAFRHELPGVEQFDLGVIDLAE